MPGNKEIVASDHRDVPPQTGLKRFLCWMRFAYPASQQAAVPEMARGTKVSINNAKLERRFPKRRVVTTDVNAPNWSSALRGCGGPAAQSPVGPAKKGGAAQIDSKRVAELVEPAGIGGRIYNLIPSHQQTRPGERHQRSMQ